MKEIIEYLREFAEQQKDAGMNSDYYGNAKMSQKEALEIADALEAATFPPIVRAVLAMIEVISPELPKDCMWCGIDSNYMTFSDKQPIYDGLFWTETGHHYVTVFSWRYDFDASNMLFHRTDNGWEWYGNPKKTQEKP